MNRTASFTTWDKPVVKTTRNSKEYFIMRRTTILLGSMFCLLTLIATAQENRSEISLQGTGFVTKSASGNGTAYSTTETGGFLSTYRYHVNR